MVPWRRDLNGTGGIWREANLTMRCQLCPWSFRYLRQASLAYWETHKQNQRTFATSVDFLTTYDQREKTVGIAILNSGPGPASIAAIRFYVDGKQVKDADEAAKLGNIDPETMTGVDMSGGTLGVGETVWLFNRTTKTKNKRELDKFIDFADTRLAIFVRSCSIANICVDKCSANDDGRCLMPVTKR